MSNIHFDLAKDKQDLQQILQLQRENLPQNIDDATAKSQGFVTVEHDLAILTAMNEPHPHIVVRLEHKVVAYALCMSTRFSDAIPILRPMFDRIRQLQWNGQLIQDKDYIIMGQVCVAKDWRGKGVFQGLYEKMQESQASNYPYVITEITSRNRRSLRAHTKVGFEVLAIYESGGEEWQIVIWEWGK